MPDERTEDLDAQIETHKQSIIMFVNQSLQEWNAYDKQQEQNEAEQVVQQATTNKGIAPAVKQREVESEGLIPFLSHFFTEGIDFIL